MDLIKQNKLKCVSLTSMIILATFTANVFASENDKSGLEYKYSAVASPSTEASITPGTNISPSPETEVTPQPSITPNEDITPMPTDVPEITPSPTVNPTATPIKPSISPKASPKPTVKPVPTVTPPPKEPIKPGPKPIVINDDKNTDNYVLKPGIVVPTLYTVKKGDNLIKIAKYFKVRYRTLLKLNNLKNPYLLIGQKVIISEKTQPVSKVDGIVVNIPENKLYYFEKGTYKETYPVTVGLPEKKWQTPIGNFKIIEKVKAPVWHVPVSIQKEMAAKGQVVKKEVPAGPDNPLGNWWMGLSVPGVGIHSTNAPLSVGYSVSHGCIRMKPNDAQELFAKVQKNLPVRIIYQPVKFSIDSKNNVYIDVHRDIYDRNINTTEVVKKMLKDFGLEKYVDWKKITPAINSKTGLSTLITKN